MTTPNQTVRWTSRGLRAVLVVLVVGVLLAFGARACRRLGATEYRTFVSPDGRFQIVVYSIPSGIVMPGQGSDVPGYFQLQDAQTGRVLRERSVTMVQLVDQIEWTTTNVNVRLLADWSLPK